MTEFRQVISAELAAVLQRALEPQHIRDLFYCRLCSAITSSRETQEKPEVHRPDCPKRPLLVLR